MHNQSLDIVSRICEISTFRDTPPKLSIRLADYCLQTRLRKTTTYGFSPIGHWRISIDDKSPKRVSSKILSGNVLWRVPVNREGTMAADGCAVAESASQIRLAPVTRSLHGPGKRLL